MGLKSRPADPDETKKRVQATLRKHERGEALTDEGIDRIPDHPRRRLPRLQWREVHGGASMSGHENRKGEPKRLKPARVSRVRA